MRYARDPQSIVAEAILDGVYGLRTRVPLDTLTATGTVRAYKSLGL